MGKGKNIPLSPLGQTILHHLLTFNGTVYYGDLAAQFCSGPRAGRAIGSVMAALGRRGYHAVCGKVIRKP